MELQQFLPWVLLPVAAASGWWAASRSQRTKVEPDAKKEPNPVYYRGLNFLLNEEPDKAIDLFVEMLEVDGDTVETHLALGNLFRRRGEVERAIRIHQNLIARPALNRDQRAQALLELGLDYMRAGLFDRAEKLFLELKQSNSHVDQVLRNLLTIYQQEKDWHACLRTADEMEHLRGVSQALEKSHYRCEMALQLRKRGQNAEAQKQLKTAIDTHKDCVRANHLLAKLVLDRGDFDEGIKLLRGSIERAPDFVPELLEELVDAYRAQGDNEGLRTYLEELALKYPGYGAELYLADMIRQQEGDAAAETYLAGFIARTPSMPGLIRLVELKCSSPESGDDQLLQDVRSYLHQLLSERIDYQCTHCGFEAKTFHWQCPSCRSWSSIRRRPLLEPQS